MRRPSPDFTTAWATRNAITTKSTLVLAKPPKACAGVIVPVITTAATASIVDVRRGNAPTSTATIADTNTAKRCQAGAVSPAGTGANQIPRASAKGTARLISRPTLIFIVGPLHRARLAPTLRGSSRSNPSIPLVLVRLQSPAQSATRIRNRPLPLRSARCPRQIFQ